MQSAAKKKNKGSAAVAAPFDPKLLALPWRKSEKSDHDWLDDYSLDVPGSCTYRHIIGGKQEVVAIVLVEGSHENASIECAARTRLVLAAGDLLSACQRMVADLREQESTHLCSRMRLDQIVDLDRAIAKATEAS